MGRRTPDTPRPPAGYVQAQRGREKDMRTKEISVQFTNSMVGLKFNARLMCVTFTATCACIGAIHYCLRPLQVVNYIVYFA